MRPNPLAFFLSAALTLTVAVPAGAATQSEKLAGSWTCHAVEGQSTNALLMTLTYRRSSAWLIGEINETSGATLLDVWLDDFGGGPLAQRRLLSNDATVEMKVVEEGPGEVRLEGTLRHILGTTAKVREVFRFSGDDAFRATWEDDSGDGWQVVLDRHCERV